MKRGIYIGYRSDLAGYMADLRPSISGGVDVKFLDPSLPPEQPGQWTQFSRLEFEILPAPAGARPC